MNITQLITGPLSVNTWIIDSGKSELLLVDPGGNPDTIISHIENLGKTLSAIIVTHGHFDHMGALCALTKKYQQIPVWIHTDDSKALGKTGKEYHHKILEFIGAQYLISQFSDSLPEPERLLNEGDILFPETEYSWQVLHTPGHSQGSICLYNKKDKMLISGDTLFKHGFGRTDIDGGNSYQLSKSLQRLSELPEDTKVFPGHGETTYIGAEFSY